MPGASKGDVDDRPLARRRSARGSSGHASVASPGSRSGVNATPMPCRSAASASAPSSRRRAATADGLFDGTAADAVEQLAASLLAELTPPWSQWFGFRPGHDVGADDRSTLAGYLEDVAERVRGHFERSTFAVEIHQCFLDLVTVGTATLLFQEAPVGEPSAFRFCAVPAAEMYIDGDQNGQIRQHYRATSLTLAGDPRPLPGRTPARLADRGRRGRSRAAPRGRRGRRAAGVRLRLHGHAAAAARATAPRTCRSPRAASSSRRS